MNPFKTLTLGTIYSYGEIQEHLKKQGESMINTTSYTYNRWNKGTPKPQPFFEYLGNGNYRYLGPKEISKYSGRLVHSPKGSNAEYQVGQWTDGKLKYLHPKINSFKDWKEWLENGYNGERIVALEDKLELLFNGESKKYMIRVTDEKNEFENGYKIISPGSKLAVLLLGKKQGDKFKFGSVEVEVMKIH
jgi:hypothetical protein